MLLYLNFILTLFYYYFVTISYYYCFDEIKLFLLI